MHHINITTTNTGHNSLDLYLVRCWIGFAILNFFKLACAKSPGVQPWIYVTHEWFMQQCQRSADISAIPSSQMRTLYPALSWEESQSAMLLYAEELQLKDCRLYKTGKRPRILPVALAWGWLRNRLDRGQIPGLAPGSFFEAFFWDQIHPSDHIVHGGHANGAYLLDLTWFAAFYRESPEGKVLPINTTLNAEQAAIVQRLAWDVIRNYPDCGLYEEGTTPVGKPEFSPGPSAIKNVTPLTLTSMTPGAWFRYTLDGTEPARTRGYVYCGVISVRTGMTVKAIAYKSGMADSPVVTATYPDKK